MASPLALWHGSNPATIDPRSKRCRHPRPEHLAPARAQLQHVPDIASMGINPDHFRGAGEKPSEERAQKHEHYAAIYNQVGMGSSLLTLRCYETH